MNKKRGVSILLLALCFGISFFYHSAFAQYTLLEGIPGIDKDTPADFPTYIQGIYNFAVGFVIVSALLMITIGGFYYISSAGNQSQAGTAKKIITDALLGLVVVFITWLVLNTINPDLVGSNPNMSSLQDSSGIVSESQEKYSYEPKADTHCGNIGGSVKCFDSKAACDSALGAAACQPLQNSLDSSKWYLRKPNGTLEEMTEDDCMDAVAGNEGACGSGAGWKSSMQYSAKSGDEVVAYIGQESDGKTTTSLSADVDIAKTTEVTQNNMAALGKDVDGVTIAEINNAAEYQVESSRNNGTAAAVLATATKTLKENATLINKVESKANGKTTTIYTYQYPNNYPDSKLAGTKAEYTKTEWMDGDELVRDFSNITITAPQAINSGYVAPENDVYEKKEVLPLEGD